MNTIPDAQSLIELLEARTGQWHDCSLDEATTGDTGNRFYDLAVSIHRRNFFQWDREEKVRRRDISSDTVAELKREIDDSNMQRARLVEGLDELCVSQLNLVERDDWSNLFLNSETLGQLVDKISILILKIFFTEKQSKRSDLDSKLREICSQRVDKLKIQLKYVAACYDRFLSHLSDGSGYMLAYKQFKMYEDRDLTR